MSVAVLGATCWAWLIEAGSSVLASGAGAGVACGWSPTTLIGLPVAVSVWRAAPSVPVAVRVIDGVQRPASTSACVIVWVSGLQL